MPITVTTSAEATAAILARLEVEVPLAAQMTLGRVGLAAGDILRIAIKDATPVSPEEQGTHLRDTTVDDVLVDGNGVAVTVVQTKTVPTRKYGDVPLAKLLEDGHPGGVEIAPIDPENGPKALAWEGPAGTMVRRRVIQGATDPNPYATDATLAALPGIRDVMRVEFNVDVELAVREAIR